MWVNFDIFCTYIIQMCKLSVKEQKHDSVWVYIALFKLYLVIKQVRRKKYMLQLPINTNICLYKIEVQVIWRRANVF